MKIRLELVAVIVAALALLLGVNTAWAQVSPLPIGTVTPPQSLGPCPAADGYANGASCYSATVIDCPNDVTLGFTYGEVLLNNSKGTVVFFNGGAGDEGPGGTEFANDYITAGYQVVQVVWDSAWEINGELINYTSTFQAYSIKDAGCRPATVLNYVYQNIYPVGKTATAGMCAQGASAGSAAVGYALAEYGAGAYLDNVELLSGPVLSDIEAGCEVPNVPSITVCPKSQPYCQTGGEGGWPDAPQYIGGDITDIDNWSDINACNGSSNTTTQENTAWKQMSIVDGLSDSSFTYSNTSVTGWLCSNTSVDCGGSGEPVCQNNSAAQGQYFYVKVTADPLTVYRVDQCVGPETVQASTATVPALDGEGGFNAIYNDMLNKCTLRH